MNLITNNPCNEIPLGTYFTTTLNMFGAFKPYSRMKSIKKIFTNENIKLTINEVKSPEELKRAAETIGLDLTKNLSKRIDLIP